MQSPPANVEMAQRSLVEAALAKGDFATPATLDHELYDAIGAADTKLRSLGASGISALRSLLDHECPHDGSSRIDAVRIIDVNVP